MYGGGKRQKKRGWEGREEYGLLMFSRVGTSGMVDGTPSNIVSGATTRKEEVPGTPPVVHSENASFPLDYRPLLWSHLFVHHAAASRVQL